MCRDLCSKLLQEKRTRNVIKGKWMKACQRVAKPLQSKVSTCQSFHMKPYTIKSMLYNDFRGCLGIEFSASINNRRYSVYQGNIFFHKNNKTMYNIHLKHHISQITSKINRAIT